MDFGTKKASLALPCRALPGRALPRHAQLRDVHSITQRTPTQLEVAWDGARGWVGPDGQSRFGRGQLLGDYDTGASQLLAAADNHGVRRATRVPVLHHVRRDVAGPRSPRQAAVWDEVLRLLALPMSQTRIAKRLHIRRDLVYRIAHAGESRMRGTVNNGK